MITIIYGEGRFVLLPLHNTHKQSRQLNTQHTLVTWRAGLCTRQKQRGGGFALLLGILSGQKWELHEGYFWEKVFHVLMKHIFWAEGRCFNRYRVYEQNSRVIKIYITCFGTLSSHNSGCSPAYAASISVLLSSIWITSTLALGRMFFANSTYNGNVFFSSMTYDPPHNVYTTGSSDLLA